MREVRKYKTIKNEDGKVQNKKRNSFNTT